MGKILPKATSSSTPNNKCLEKTISALRSKTRRKILKLLVRGPKNVREVFDELGGEGIEIKYPESVYKALEMLVDCGLVEKYYNKRKGLLYKPLKLRIEIDLSKL